MVRLKHRYLLVHILYPELSEPAASKPPPSLPDFVHFHRPTSDGLTPQLLSRLIKDQVQLLYGDCGSGLVSGSLNVKYLSPATSTAIVRCSRAHYRLVWAALSFVTQLPKTERQGSPQACVFQVVRVSGTIKKAEEEAIRRARAAILKAQRVSSEGATDGLQAILGNLEGESGADVREPKGRDTRAGIEDHEEDEGLESDSNG